MSGMVASLAGSGGVGSRGERAATVAKPQPARILARLAVPARGWPVVLLAIAPAFLFRGPLAAEQVLALAFAFLGLLLTLFGTGLLAACRQPSGGGEGGSGRIFGVPFLLLGLAIAAMPAPGIAVLAALMALCHATRHAVPPLPLLARLLLTAFTAALAFDAGTIALNMTRSLDLVAWAGAVAVFGELAVGQGDLVLHRNAAPQPPSRAAARRDLALGLAALAAVALYLMRLPQAGMDTPWEAGAGYAALAFFLLALWRGYRPNAASQGDPLLIGAIAGWALSSGFAHGSALQGLPLAGS